MAAANRQNKVTYAYEYRYLNSKNSRIVCCANLPNQ